MVKKEEVLVKLHGKPLSPNKINVIWNWTLGVLIPVSIALGLYAIYRTFELM